MSLSITPALADRIAIDPPPHRVDRLRAWMESEGLDACVAFGPKHASHLAGYARCWTGHAAGAGLRRRPRVTEIDLFSAALRAAQTAHGSPIEFTTDLLSGPKTADVCCPIHSASPRALEPGEHVVADIALGAG